jgi:hypothetical protein
MNDFWKRMSISPICRRYVPLMKELEQLNEDCSIDIKKTFTYVDYVDSVTKIDIIKYPQVKYEGHDHVFRCNDDNSKCTLCYLAVSPNEYGLNYCMNEYADKFR